MRLQTYPCPCCGYEVFAKALGSYDICPICCWEDDIVQLAFPDMRGGPNECSLIEGQRNFASFGACEQRLKEHVRAPESDDVRNSEWRPIDVERDRYLRSGDESDCELWKSAMNLKSLCLYYWSPLYWLGDGSWMLPDAIKRLIERTH